MKNYLLERKTRKYLKLFLVILALAIFTVFIPHTFGYNKEAFIRTWTGAYSNAPLAVQESIREEHNNLYPPRFYKKDTWEWINSFCTYNECE